MGLLKKAFSKKGSSLVQVMDYVLIRCKWRNLTFIEHLIITKYHRLGGLSKRHYFLPFWRLGSLRSRCQQIWCPIKAHSWLVDSCFLTVCSHGLFLVCAQGGKEGRRGRRRERERGRGREGGREREHKRACLPISSSSYKGTNPIMETPPS